jgi:hypothetical protein
MRVLAGAEVFSANCGGGCKGFVPQDHSFFRNEPFQEEPSAVCPQELSTLQGCKICHSTQELV